MAVLKLKHTPLFLKQAGLDLSRGIPALCRHPGLHALPHLPLAGPAGRELSGGGSPGVSEKSSAWSAGGGKKLLPNQLKPVAGEDLQPPNALSLPGYQITTQVAATTREGR